MKKNQKGFSAVEGLLILIVVVLIGGVGWYVWQGNRTKPITPTQIKVEKIPSNNVPDLSHLSEKDRLEQAFKLVKLPPSYKLLSSTWTTQYDTTGSKNSWVYIYSVPKLTYADFTNSLSSAGYMISQWEAGPAEGKNTKYKTDILYFVTNVDNVNKLKITISTLP